MFYHVSLETNKIIKEFTPRVPIEKNRMVGEDRVSERICVGKTIEDCLSAFPKGGYVLLGDSHTMMRVYEFDENDVEKENIISPTELFFSEKVPDAWVTGEYWITNQTLKPVRSYVIKLKRVVIDDAPHVNPDVFEEAYKASKTYDEMLDILEKKSDSTVARIMELEYRKLS